MYVIFLGLRLITFNKYWTDKFDEPGGQGFWSFLSLVNSYIMSFDRSYTRFRAVKLPQTSYLEY